MIARASIEWTTRPLVAPSTRLRRSTDGASQKRLRSAASLVSAVALIGAAIIHTFNYDRDYYIPVEAVAEVEDTRTRLLSGAR